MSHPLLGQRCDRGEEIIGRSPLQERYADMQSGRGVIRATDHLTEEADSQGESVETGRDSDSDSETEIVLRAASPVVPVSGQQFIVPPGHIVQPQRQAMEAVRKFISPPIFQKNSEEDAHELMECFEEYSTHNRWGDIRKKKNVEKYFDDAARSWFKCARLPNEWMKISTVESPVLKKGDLSRVKREIGYLFAEMSHPLLGQRCDRGEEIIGRSPL
ncbi:hypothetical protein OUZ56_017616 [Daphnia magna]|uniref:Uncharacterized protein n=1 Tax=Daphnia magna TaxID=35525 RepID=A0ABR0AT93_9CRUS|nr:hypothetical protein OUZ56_017616 [Daphnia magna]